MRLSLVIALTLLTCLVFLLTRAGIGRPMEDGSEESLGSVDLAQTAQTELEDAEDEAILGLTMPVENITGEQALEMLAAASRRYARREWELETARKLVDRQSLAPASLTSYQRERDRAYEQWEAADSRFRFIQQRSRRSRSGWLLQARLITSRFQARARLATANCLPLDQNALSGTISGAAAAHRLDPALLRAMIRQESAFYPCAISSKGAMGLMQLMPATAEQFHLADPFDPSSNIDAGAEYMRSLLDRFEGDLPLALASYNAGPNRQNQKAALDIPETRNYVKQILNSLEPATVASFSLAK